MSGEKVNRTQRADIAARLRLGERRRDLAREYGISLARVSQIVRSWDDATNAELAEACGDGMSKALLQKCPPPRQRPGRAALKIIAAIVFRPSGEPVSQVAKAMGVTHQRLFEVIAMAKRYGLINDEYRLVTHEPYRSLSRRPVAPESPFVPSLDKKHSTE